uniref:Uncharacterized protein n=1 Tax=Prunus dulcis TaxID=3755 RepID=Q9XH10_PRUDU|nr:unknown [Prunus dulcis]
MLTSVYLAWTWDARCCESSNLVMGMQLYMFSPRSLFVDSQWVKGLLFVSCSINQCLMGPICKKFDSVYDATQNTFLT